MSSPKQPYTVIAQASPQEILQVTGPTSLNLVDLETWESVAKLIIAMPAIEDAECAQHRLAEWGFDSFIGDPYNVARRVLDACAYAGRPQSFSVRVVAYWKHVDLSLIDGLVTHMERRPCDAVLVPPDFEYTLAADVASHDALEAISALSGKGPVDERARFNPWGYLESRKADYDVHYVEPADVYDRARIDRVLATRRQHGENVFFGCGYRGSGYHLVADELAPGQRILDAACGSAFGSALLSERADKVVGVDYDSASVVSAQARYPGRRNMELLSGDLQTFVYRDGGWFDVAISFHTLEHVDDDAAMLNALRDNLRPRGQLVIEVPLQAQRPLGVPINPHHHREYTRVRLLQLLNAAGFEVQREVGFCRGFSVDASHARDALQVWATKP